MAIDWNRPLQTATGRSVRLIARDLDGVAPFAVAVKQLSGAERLHRVDENGASPDSNLQLENIFTTSDVWANVYNQPDGSLTLGRSYRNAAAAAANVTRQQQLVGRNLIIVRAEFDDGA
jgi:hypothetical protein